jgi:hypothetical protein
MNINIIKDSFFEYSDPFLKLQKLRKIKGKFRFVIKDIMANPRFLLYAYSCINSRFIVSHTFKSIFFNFDKKFKFQFIELSNLIKSGLYVFKDVSQVSVKFLYGKKKLIAGVSADQIVQKALQLLLEVIYKNKLKKFYRYFSGFKVGMTSQSILQEIKST